MVTGADDQSTLRRFKREPSIPAGIVYFMEEPLVASEYGSEWIYSCRFRVGGGKGCCWVEGRKETEDAGSLLSESCLIPWKPVIHKPNYVQVECHLWQNETNASFVWLGFLMKSCFTSRFYFHKCLFKKKKKPNHIFPHALLRSFNQCVESESCWVLLCAFCQEGEKDLRTERNALVSTSDPSTPFWASGPCVPHL